MSNALTFLRPGLVADVVQAAVDQGWEVGMTSKCHIRLVPADKTMPIVITGGTPGDRRSGRHFLAQARRSGLIWPPEKGSRYA